MKSNSQTLKIIQLIVLMGVFTFISSCSDDGENGANNSGLSYTDIGPGLGSNWNLVDAKRTDTGLWARYTSYELDAEKLARYDFQSKQWQFWDFDETLWDFDVSLIGDNGTGAIVVVDIPNEWSNRVYSLGSTIEWDIENIDQWAGHVAIGWGSGPAAFSKWIGGSQSGHAVYQETGTCCPMQWNKIDILPSAIYNMWASSRQDGYVLVSSAQSLYIVFGDGGSEIIFPNAPELYSIHNIAWDIQTGSAYTLIDGILYRIEDNPNANSGQAVILADLSSYYTAGITDGYFGIDIRNGHAFGPYGIAVELSTGAVKTSWIGEVDPTDIEGFTMAQAIASSSYIFAPPNDQQGLIAYVRTMDIDTFEYYETWMYVNNAL
ncbi:MAG TPA: hypothetical protein VFD80_05240 [Flavobacteriaceae bacterium]|nr:hypothetical protein [Flavobacteriaceae bacterium]